MTRKDYEELPTEEEIEFTGSILIFCGICLGVAIIYFGSLILETIGGLNV